MVLALCFAALVAITGCTPAEQPQNERISVVCTIFPPYDWVCQILGEQAAALDLTLLINNRNDLHNYQPSVDDMIKIATCDLLIYVGGESDRWVEDALKNTVNQKRVALNLMNLLGSAVKPEETFADPAAVAKADPTETDEHVWLSLNNARLFCPVIAAALEALTPEYAGVYRANLALYLEKLAGLDLAYREAVAVAPVKCLLFGDRFPFRYLTDDYGLTAYAAFPGCSAETEASFATVLSLAQKTDELRLKRILVTESADQALARTIISNTNEQNQQILVMDAMQATTLKDFQNGATYLSVMEYNLEILKEALE